MKTAAKYHLNRILILAFLVLISTVIYAQWDKCVYGKTCSHSRIHNGKNYKSAFIESASHNDWDLTFNRLTLDIDPNNFYVDGDVYFEFTSLVNNLNQITIDMSGALSVLSIKSGDSNLSYVRQGDKITITLIRNLNKGQRGHFTVIYQGKPNSSGFGSIFQDKRRSEPTLYTLSEPVGAKDWWPCKQSLSDKIDSIDIIIKSPSQYRSASNGMLVSDEVWEGKRTCYWKHRHPIATYLVFFSTTNYAVYTEYAQLGEIEVPIVNYVYPETLAQTKSLTRVTKDYLEYFSHLFIDYPFKDEKYGHAQFGWMGGMEHQTMSSMGLFPDFLIAHELAHQWFGDYITCGTWNEIWLNESFATYAEGLVYEQFNKQLWENWKQNQITVITSKPGGKIYVDDIDDIGRLFDSRLTYDKSSFVLHMLRGQTGDSAFFEGLRNYLTDPRCINGFATTDILRENIEKAAGFSLVNYFDDWIYSEGFPIYDTRWDYANGILEITVFQQPSVTNGPFFELKLPFTVSVDGVSTVYWLNNTEQGQQFSIPLTKAPERVVFNNDRWILCKEDRFQTIAQTINNRDLKIAYSRDQKKITVWFPGYEKVDYTIFDIHGRVVKKGYLLSNMSDVFVEQAKPGNYLLKISNGDYNSHSRFTIY